MPPPTSLYVHIPFCASRCGYCTFTSTLYSPDRADVYLDALEKELRARTLFSAKFLPETIFIGGGTPSVLTTKQLKKLFSFLPESKGEFTCEINPDSCSREKLLLLRDSGVNRLSFGVQTFDPSGLYLLQRRHTAEQTMSAVSSAMAIGFTSINLDLINGWPGQTDRSFEEDIDKATRLGIQHLSNYTLILDPSAPACAHYRELLGGDMVDEETGIRFWELGEELLAARGFVHYETSNFSLPGHQCVHNVMTWRGEEYLGIGLGACSHIAGERRGNTDDIARYCGSSGIPDAVVAYSEKLGPEEKARECAVFWLRLFEGVERDAFREKTGFAFQELYRDVLPGLIAGGIIVSGESHIRVDRRFHPVLDSVLEHFISCSENQS